MGHFTQNQNGSYMRDPFVDANRFIGQKTAYASVPDYKTIKNRLPVPIWDGHGEVIDCYYKAWEIAFGNLLNPTAENGFTDTYIDTAFNDCIFMWDSSFMTMFGKYAGSVFNFQKTLNNFYAKQHMDGFICREIDEADGKDRFYHHSPESTGPDILGWSEWSYYKSCGDTDRLREVFFPLFAYHRWLKTYRTWRDGSYWACGLSCGMDNMPRLRPDFPDCDLLHGNQVWADTCFQQILSAKILLKISEILIAQKEERSPLQSMYEERAHLEGVPYAVKLKYARLLTWTEIIQTLSDEIESLENYVNTSLWDEKTSFYYDLWPDCSLSTTKSIGAYWALLADSVDENRLEPFIAHLENEKEFKRPHRIPVLSADHHDYEASGGYWCGSVWAPTNYMVLKGLENKGYHSLAFDIACNHVRNVVNVYKKTGTLWENYAPESENPGAPAKKDFVGWTGLVPISVLFENVFGICPDFHQRKIIWRINLPEEHGVKQYPFGSSGLIDLVCKKRSTAQEMPVVCISSNIDFCLEIFWDNGRQSKCINIQKNR